MGTKLADMPHFVVQEPFDPYNQFKFRLKWDGRYVAGVTRVGPLARRTEVINQRSGGDPGVARRSPGPTLFDPIVMERGITLDKEFEEWADSAWDATAGSGSESAPIDFRKDITLEVYNEAGQLVVCYRIYKCWVSEYQALPELDASSSAVAYERIVLQNEGWARDKSVQEPRGPITSVHTDSKA
jgi:phage tail-like protein